VDLDEVLAATFSLIAPHLTERQRRLLFGAAARRARCAGPASPPGSWPRHSPPGGHPVSDDTVGRLLREQGYRLQRTVKTLEGAQHADRDAQFRYLNEQAKVHLAEGQPVVSVDTKKKELVGAFANGGREWQPSSEPERVNVHDFPDPKLGKTIPYGVYDLGRNTGWVSVGTDHDTAAFAAATLRRWREQVGQRTYPATDRLLICADAGGSNGYRVRAWKLELAKLAQETGLQITVCHLPPGTSKWNRIEHRLVSAISMNWRGRTSGLRRSVSVSGW
jgi:hypothetical protein